MTCSANNLKNEIFPGPRIYCFPIGAPIHAMPGQKMRPLYARFMMNVTNGFPKSSRQIFWKFRTTE